MNDGIGKGAGEPSVEDAGGSRYHLCLTDRPTEDFKRLLNRHLGVSISNVEYRVLSALADHIDKLEQRIKELENES